MRLTIGFASSVFSAAGLIFSEPFNVGTEVRSLERHSSFLVPPLGLLPGVQPPGRMDA